MTQPMKKISDPRLAPNGAPALCSSNGSWPVPDDDWCFQLWDHFAMPEHIRAHSMVVATIAECVARTGLAQGMNVDPVLVRSSGLLHDLAKDYAIRHGGNHAQLGGAWALAATGNPQLAMGVLHHVHWPWEIDIERCFLPLAVIYADKRVQHDVIVGVENRYDDLIERYGRGDAHIIERINESRTQSLEIEQAFNQLLGIDLNACSFDSRGLVE